MSRIVGTSFCTKTVALKYQKIQEIDFAGILDFHTMPFLFRILASNCVVSFESTRSRVLFLTAKFKQKEIAYL